VESRLLNVRCLLICGTTERSAVLDRQIRQTMGKWLLFDFGPISFFLIVQMIPHFIDS